MHTTATELMIKFIFSLVVNLLLPSCGGTDTKEKPKLNLYSRNASNAAINWTDICIKYTPAEVGVEKSSGMLRSSNKLYVM
ncbi:hypothetical protein D3C87_1997550 [compost metagenome]